MNPHDDYYDGVTMPIFPNNFQPFRSTTTIVLVRNPPFVNNRGTFSINDRMCDGGDTWLRRVG